MRQDLPLVSLGIVTYNSSRYVVEALESMKAQTYPNVELIVSDDCSTDNTVDIVKEWLTENKDRFVRTKLITVPYNTGTAANCNREMAACRGEWVKSIAGDDKLIPECIEKFMQFINKQPDADIIFGNVKGFGDKEAAQKWEYSNPQLFFEKLTPRQMLLNLYEQNFFPAAARFDKKSCWEEIGRFNENIPLIEDWPFMVKIFAAKKKVCYMGEDVCWYRFSNTSVSHPQKNNSTTTKYAQSREKASEYARKMMKEDSIGGWFYANFSLEVNNNPIKKYLFHPFDALNPFRYEYLKARKKFKAILEEIKEEKQKEASTQI